MKLTAHFTLEELTFSDTAKQKGLDNTPPAEVKQNLVRLAEFLEDIRALFPGKVIKISSGYRSPKVNAAVGGAKASDHLTGCAADIKVPGLSPDEVCRTIIASGLDFHKLIREYDRWTHVSIAPEGIKPAGLKLIIDKQTPSGRAFL